jgi:hypothetical protein
MDAGIHNVIYMELYSGPKNGERWMRENDQYGNDRSRFHCICRTANKINTFDMFPEHSLSSSIETVIIEGSVVL